MHYTSGKHHKDPKPWVSRTVERHRVSDENGHPSSVERYRWFYDHEPRPEFDNHNPILVELRRCVDLGASLPAMVQVFRNWYRFGKAEKIPATLAQSDHAWRVLAKLAALNEEQS